MPSTHVSGKDPVVDPSPRRAFEVEECDPLDLETELKALFLEEEAREFVDFFDHSYAKSVEMGGTSVVARDPDGKLIMHVAAFPRIFRRGNERIPAGLLGDLLVRPAYRDFWSPIAFFRNAVEILARSSRFAFLFTDPGSRAFALTRAAGFDLLDSLRWYGFALLPGSLTAVRMKLRVQALRIERAPWNTLALDEVDTAGLDSGDLFRVERSPSFYVSRQWTNLTQESEWIILRPSGDAPDAPPVALALTTPFAEHRTLAIVDVRWNPHRIDPESVLYTTLIASRKRGYRKVGTMATSASTLGTSLRKCGFIPRDDEQPILTRTLRADFKLPEPSKWILTWIDGSAW